MTRKASPGECRFCAIVRGDLPAFRVFDTPLFAGFLDARPLLVGHTLIVPRAHRRTLVDLSPQESAALGPLLARVVRAVQLGLEAQGAAAWVNHVVSQSIPHLHVHVVPRRKGDGFRGLFWPRTRYASDEEARGVAEAIGSAFTRLGDGEG